jgi:hypothetical protein
MRETIKNYVWKADTDQDMLDMYAADRADLQKVLDLYEAGQWKRAYKFAQSMDTAPREHIDDLIYDDICS